MLSMNWGHLLLTLAHNANEITSRISKIAGIIGEQRLNVTVK